MKTSPIQKVNLYLVFLLMKRIKISLGGHKRYWISEFQYQEILLPDVTIQKQMASILSDTQQEVDLLKQLTEKYKIQKCGLMQKLLTGIWRVKPEIVRKHEEIC